MRVRRRHIVYVQGYDPRGLAQYYRMFRNELRKFLKLYDLKADVSRPEQSDGNTRARWTISTAGPDWSVETTYDFLRWEDIIAKDFSRHPVWVIGACFWVLVRMITTGALVRFFGAQWRFALFVLYPYVVFLAQAAVAIAAGFGVARLAAIAALPGWAGTVAGIAVAAALLTAMVRWLEPRTYMLYLMNDIVSTYQFAQGRRPDWSERMAQFARHLTEATRHSDADELIVIGHSSGSFLAVDVLAQALKADPDLGRYTPRLRLLTLGANLPIVGFAPAAQWFRDQLRALAVAPDVDWIDWQARKDVMNFFAFDPIKGHRIDVGASARNPIHARMRLRKLIDPQIYPWFRWRFFRVHFQFIMANDLADAYDFFMFLCGPIDLVSRARDQDAALAAMTQAGEARSQAWRKLGLSAEPGEAAAGS